MSTHEELQRSLGSYVLGSLEPAERAEVQAHLNECRTCTRELASYAGLPALLSRVPLAEVATTPAPSELGLPRLLAAVEGERRARDQRLRRWQVAAGGLAAAAALVVGVTVAPPSLDRGGDARTLVSSAAAEASGTIELESRPWGTSVRLRVAGLPEDRSYTAWATEANGTRTAVATWRGTASREVDVTGATSLRLDSVRSVSVSAGGQGPVLTFNG